MKELIEKYKRRIDRNLREMAATTNQYRYHLLDGKNSTYRIVVADLDEKLSESQTSESLRLSDVMCSIPANDLQKIVDEWWDKWHRYVDVDDKIPAHIYRIAECVCKATGKHFNTETGCWNVAS